MSQLFSSNYFQAIFIIGFIFLGLFDIRIQHRSRIQIHRKHYMYLCALPRLYIMNLFSLILSKTQFSSYVKYLLTSTLSKNVNAFYRSCRSIRVDRKYFLLELIFTQLLGSLCPTNIIYMIKYILKQFSQKV